MLLLGSLWSRQESSEVHYGHTDVLSWFITATVEVPPRFSTAISEALPWYITIAAGVFAEIYYSAVGSSFEGHYAQYKSSAEVH